MTPEREKEIAAMVEGWLPRAHSGEPWSARQGVQMLAAIKECRAEIDRLRALITADDSILRTERDGAIKEAIALRAEVARFSQQSGEWHDFLLLERRKNDALLAERERIMEAGKALSESLKLCSLAHSNAAAAEARAAIAAWDALEGGAK